MTRITTLMLCVALGTIPAIASNETSQAPQAPSSTTRLVPVTGVLTDAAGTPLTGAHTIIVTLFDEAEGGTALWVDTLPVTADARGRYAAHLGSGLALPLDLFYREQARWLGVTVEGHDLPRTILTAVPYALKAADADTLGGKPVSSFVTTGADGKVQRFDGTALDAAAVDGSGVTGQIAKWSSATTLSSSVISESASNRIGVGLPDPTGGGVVDSVFSIKNFDNNTGFAILNETQQRRFALNTLPNGGWLLYDGGNNTWNAGLSQRAGNLAIGTTPLSNTKLTMIPPADGAGIYVNPSGTSSTGVRGDTDAGYGIIGVAYGAGTGVYGQSGTGFAGYFFGPRTYISGNLGVGTSIPGDKLDVRGDIRVGTGTTGCVKDADATVLTGTCSSDFRFKKNINAFAGTLGKLSQLQPVYFDWRADEFPDHHFGAARSFGLIAQEVEAVLPELVVTDEKGYKAVKYHQLPFHMLQAIKELKTENDTLKEQLQTQEERLLTQTDALKTQLLTQTGMLKQQTDALKQQTDALKTQEDRLRRLEALAGK